jgi:hypothetical protein
VVVPRFADDEAGTAEPVDAAGAPMTEGTAGHAVAEGAAGHAGTERDAAGHAGTERDAAGHAGTERDAAGPGAADGEPAEVGVSGAGAGHDDTSGDDSDASGRADTKAAGHEPQDADSGRAGDDRGEAASASEPGQAGDLGLPADAVGADEAPATEDTHAAAGRDADHGDADDGDADDGGAGGEGAGADAASQSPLDDEVTIVPGVARYHRRGCILIRFLSDGDLETMTRRAAEATGSVPCKACQPDKPASAD